MQITKGKQSRPRRVLIYGENGIGKSTFAAKFPNPLFLNFEDGVGDIDADKTPLLTSYGDAVSAVSWLTHNDREHQTIIVDTVDWLEKHIMREVAQKKGKETIEEIGYGKGWETVAQQWRFLLSGFTVLWNQGRHIIFVAHATIRKYKNPEGDAYDFLTPALNEAGSGLILEWCDEVLYAKSRVNTIQKDEGFNQKRSVAIGGKERMLVTSESAAYVAKNRLGLPDELPLDFAAFAKYLPPLPPLACKGGKNIDGIVKEGTSKTVETSTSN